MIDDAFLQSISFPHIGNPFSLNSLAKGAVLGVKHVQYATQTLVKGLGT